MGVIILTLFGIAITLALLEDNLEEASKKRAYWIFCGILVLVAGLREVGLDPILLITNMHSFIMMMKSCQQL